MYETFVHFFLSALPEVVCGRRVPILNSIFLPFWSIPTLDSATHTTVPHNYWKNLISGYIWHFTIYIIISCYAFLLLINYYIVSLFLFFCLFHLLKKKIIQSNSLLKNWHRLYTFFLSGIYVHEVIIHDYVSFMNHDEDIRYVMSNELW